MQNGVVWDENVSVYKQQDAMAVTVEGMTPHFIQLAPGAYTTLVNGFPPTKTYPTPVDDGSILTVATKVNPSGDELKWSFDISLAPLRALLPDGPSTLTLSLDVAFNSDSNLVSDSSVRRIKFDVGKATLRVLSSYVVLPYLHNADTSQVFHALYSITYQHVEDLVHGKLTLVVRQKSRPSNYGVGYDLVARIYGYEFKIELNADAGNVEDPQNNSPPSPGLASPAPDECALSNEWTML